MTDLPVYDVRATCLGCGEMFTTKSFVQRTHDTPTTGRCPACCEKDDQRMAELKKPPKAHGKPKPPEPPKQYRWEPD